MAFGLVTLATLVAEGAETSSDAGGELAPDRAGRLRGGYDLGVTVGMATASNGCNGNGGESCFLVTPTFGGELGYQAGRHFAVMLRGELGLAGVFNYGGGYLMLEATPTRVLSLAAGGGVEGTFAIFGTALQSYGGVAIPVIARFNFMKPSAWAAPGRKAAWRLGVEAVPGFEPNLGMFMMRGGLTLGYSYM